MVQSRDPVLEFGDFRLEPATRRLLKNGRALPLAPKDFDLLLVLVRLRNRAVGREELLRLLWPDVVVEEANLSQHVFTLRHWLGDHAEGARLIETLPRHGYRFVAEVRELAEAGDAAGTVAAGEGQPTRAAADGQPPAKPRRRVWLWAGAAAVAVLAAGLAGVLLARRGAESPMPRVQPLTARRGIVYTARFDPGGTAVYYSASWDSGPSRTYVTRPGSGASAEVALPGSVRLLSVSRRGELALLLDPPLASFGWAFALATLAVAPATGGPPRRLADYVRGADWGPDGESLAVVRVVRAAGGDKRRLEYPLGRVLVESTPDSYFCLSSPRVSPRGDRVAYLDCEATTGAHEVRTVDTQGHQQRHYRGQPYRRQGESVWGLSWSPEGDEIWFALKPEHRLAELMAVDLRGRTRRLGTLGGHLLDVSSSGEALTRVDSYRGGLVIRRSDARAEHEFWTGEYPLGLAASHNFTLSSDGRFVLRGEGLGGDRPRVLLQPTDGSPSVALGEGFSGVLAPDGQRALLLTDDQRDLQLVPTGAGEAKRLSTAPLRVYAAWFFADGRRVLLGAAEPGKAGRLWVLDLAGGPPRPITPEQVGVGVPSPDGRWVATMGFDGAALYPVDRGERRALGDLGSTHLPVVWSDDGCCVYWAPLNLPGKSLTILRLDLRTGERAAWREIAPADPAGLIALWPEVTPDGRTCVYAYERALTTLNLVSGLR